MRLLGFVFLAAAFSTGACASPTGPSATTYTGPFAAQLVVVTTSGQCISSSTRSLSGTITVTLNQENGTVTGRGDAAGTETETANVMLSGRCAAEAVRGSLAPPEYGGPVTGTTGSFSWSQQGSLTFDIGVGGVSNIATTTNSFEFSGALSGSVVLGTATHTQTSQNSLMTVSSSGSVTFPVTLN